jgi:prevent-host-death family protein
MAEVASRDLRNRTRALLDRVAAGERITITVDGRPVAELTPFTQRARWMKRDRFIREVLAHQADHALADELAALADETTDDLPL